MIRISRERRRRQRVYIALPITIKYNKEEILANTKNISILGTYLEIDKEIPRGITLDITVTLPQAMLKKTAKSKKIRCTGVSFRCHPAGHAGAKTQYGIGIFFRSFSRDGEKDLSNCIDHILLQEQKEGKIYMRRRRRKQSRRKGGKR